MDDFPDFDEDDFTTTRPEMSTAREERIAAARAASASYSAKIEDPAWFNQVQPIVINGKPNRYMELYKLDHLYLKRSYSKVIELGLALLLQGQYSGYGPDQLELYDMLMTAALKGEGNQVDSRIVEIAEGWKGKAKSHPGFSFKSAQIYHKILNYQSAAEACLWAIHLRGRLTPYLSLLLSIFTHWTPSPPFSSSSSSSSSANKLLLQHINREIKLVTELDRKILDEAIRSFELSSESVVTLMKLLESTEEEVEDTTSRDVRSL